AVEQILPESAFADLLCKILVGCGKYAHIHRDRFAASNPGDDSLLQCSQNLGLRREAHVADLVEEQGSPVRELELARAILVRSGERALHVAKQLRLDQFGGDRGAIDFDEWMVGARR